jgi:predicted Zn-dependent protease with MMP-like domain
LRAAEVGCALEAFEDMAVRLWDRIPEEMKEGVEALVIEDQELGHPTLGGVYTLGECVTETWPSGYGEAGDVRSELILYYGSFRALAREDESFEWEAEAWETILHELLHHREAAAGESALDELDWAIDQNFRRLAGRPFDPAFPRSIPTDSDGAVRLDSETFLAGRPGERPGTMEFIWRGRRYGIRISAREVTLFVRIRNLAGGRLVVVVPARESLVRRILGIRPRGSETLSRRALPPALS